jgi:hypothetical protein
VAINDKLAAYDGFQAIVSGVDSGRSPAVLDRDQLSWSINTTTRGGFVTCRPGWKPCTLTFASEAVQTAFETGRFQGASPYYADNGSELIIASISGRIFKIDTKLWTVEELTSASDRNRATEPRAWFCQAEQFLIIQNSVDKPFIYDGATLRRSNPVEGGGSEVPPGKMMEYNKGRLWVVLPNGYSFVAGDLAYGDVEYGRANVLRFTENTFLNGGGYFAVPSNAGPIVALRSIAIQDSTTGQGPLQIFTTRGAFSVNAPFDRTQWQNTNSPIQTISLLSSGACSQWACVNVNGDIWFRSPDGVRSFMIAQRDYGTWSNTPMSREVDRAVNFDTPELLEFSSAVLFDNRLLLTVQPNMLTISGVQRGVYHRGLVVLDFAPISHMLNRTQPIWDGLWTGLNIYQILTIEGARSRCFIFNANSDNEIELWELTTSDRFDSTDNRIQWSFETPAYGFADGGWNLKELAYADLWLDRLAGQVDFTAYYRPDSYPFWLDWHTWEDCALIQSCTTDQCDTPAQRQEQYRARTRLPAPPRTCDSVTNKPNTQGYRFQSKLSINGFARLRQLRLVARNLPEIAEGGCP